MRIITNETLEKYKKHLIDEERSVATINKYIYDVGEFSKWIANKEIEKSDILLYKERLIGKYAPASVNAALSSLNSFFDFMQWHDMRVKSLKIQKQMFASKEKELTKSE